MRRRHTGKLFACLFDAGELNVDVHPATDSRVVICRNPSLQRRAAQNLFEMRCWRVQNSTLDGDSVYCSTGVIGSATVIAMATVIANGPDACYSGTFPGVCPYTSLAMVWVDLQDAKVAVPYYSQGTFRKHCFPVDHL